MSKSDIRHTMLAARRELTLEEWTERSHSVVRRLIQLIEEWRRLRRIDCVHCYIPSPGRRELDTRPLINGLFSMGCTVAVPKVHPREPLMESHAIRDLDGLSDPSASPFGIPEPVDGPIVAPSDLDLAVVPCLAVDRFGNRIGYGGGYYDRYLSRTRAATVCPCFDFQLHDSIFDLMEDGDRAIDWIVTESETIPTGAAR